MISKYYLSYLIILLIFSLALYFFRNELILSAAKTIIHADEAGYICKLKYADLFSRGDFSSYSWKEGWAYDSPLLMSYINGLALRFSKYHSFPASFLCQQASQVEKKMGWNDPQGKKLYLPPEQIPVLATLRTISVNISLLSALLIGLISLLVGGWLAALGAFFLLFYNPFFFKVGVWAIADPLLLFLLLLAVVVGFLLLRSVFLERGNQYLCLAIIAGMIGGLALSVKINGFLALIYLLFPLLLGLGIKPYRLVVCRKRFLLTLFIVSIIFVVLFFLLHPQLYKDPLGGIGEMVARRFSEAEFHKRSFPEPMAPLPERIPQFIQALFWQYDSWRILLGAKTPFLSLGLFLVGLAILADRVFNDYRKGFAGNSLVFFGSLLATFIMVFSYIPMNWDRYYLPLIPWVVIV